MRKILFALLLLLILCATAYAEEIIYPTTVGKLDAQVRMYGNGTILGLEKGEQAKFQTLTFQESEFQKVQVVTEALYINGDTIYPTHIVDEFGNRYVVFSIPQNGDFNYEIIADIQISSLIREVRDYNCGEVEKAAQMYLLPSEKIESTSAEIITAEKNKLYSNSFSDSLNKTIIWVNDYVEYAQGKDFTKYYLLQKSAMETLLEKKGVCDEFSNLAAGLLRAKGFATKIATGITFDGKDWGNHAWIEIYHDKMGTWIPSDPTFRESGFVDAMHIKIGSFTDVSLSLAKAFFPQKASVTFYTQTIPDVKIRNKEYFDQVKIEAPTAELKTMQWNDVNVKITNLTNRTMIVPLKIQTTTNNNKIDTVACVGEKANQCLIVEEAKQSIMLAPKEIKSVTFWLYPNISLDAQHYIQTNLTYYSLSEPATQSAKILKGVYGTTGKFVINDVTPIAHEKQLLIQIQITNFFPEDKRISISIKSDSVDINGEEMISSFTSKTITRKIDNYDDDAYYLKIITPTSTLTQTIVPEKQKMIIVPTDKNVTQITGNKPVVNQIIDVNKEGNLANQLVANPIIIIIVALAGVAIMLFILFWVNKRYV